MKKDAKQDVRRSVKMELRRVERECEGGEGVNRYSQSS